MMVEQRSKRACVVAALLALLCSLAFLAFNASTPPQAYGEGESNAETGLIHIAVTVDRTAEGSGPICVWLPINADNPTVETVMNKCLIASEDKTDRFAHKDYATQSLADYLSGKNFTVAVYQAGSQQPGASAEYSSESIGDETYAQLANGDAVYFTVVE